MGAGMRDEKTVQIRDEWLVPTVENRDALAFSPGRYRLCFEVASGGMATVYLALYHGMLGFERVVAVKTIHRHLAKERQFVDMFLDEARIAAHIDHPFVCKVVDFGEARDTYYIAMEYVLGQPLSSVWETLEQKPALATEPELPYVMARVVADLAEGLHAAHELTDEGKPLGIVHRDVTPANLFVLYDGTVRVVDFGIAKAENKLHHTETGTVKGKYAYLSPEQLSAKKVDCRSDLFSLGVVLWEMLTATRLFKRDSPMETMQRVMRGNVPPPSNINPAVPRALDAIVLKTLARRRSDRYASARELAVTIEHFLADSGRTVPKADVSEWLKEIFPGDYARKRQLVELTRRGETAVPMTSPPGERVPEPTTVRRRPLARPSSEASAAPSASRPLDAHGQTEPAEGAVDDRASHSDSATAASESPRSESPNESSSARPADGEADRDDDRDADVASKNRPLVGGAALRAPVETRRSSSGRRRSRLLPGILLGAAALGGGAVIASVTLPSDGAAPTSRRGTPSADAEREPASDSPSTTSGETSPAHAEDEEPRDAGPASVVIAGEPGTLRVMAPSGWAEIWFNGERVGQTGEQLSLPPGQLVLDLRPYGRVAEARPLSVEIRSGRTVFARVVLPEP
jgi:serine/threonine-protein kinase